MLSIKLTSLLLLDIRMYQGRYGYIKDLREVARVIVKDLREVARVIVHLMQIYSP